jgi:hypothetical protein
MKTNRNNKQRTETMTKKEIKTCIKRELSEMLWTDGSADVYYYCHPLPSIERPNFPYNYTSTACAIKKTYDLSGKPYFVVFWDGFGIVQSRDLNTLKKDVEQLVRIKRTKEF